MIITNNEEALRVHCEDVLEHEVGELVSLLEAELLLSAKNGNPGIGLAAPQIGIAKNIAIVRLGKNYNVDLINCKIEKKYDQKIFEDEGCLSFPGRSERTNRFQEIYVTGNLKFPHTFIAKGLPAVVIQHELDHLNKILLPDVAIPKQFLSKNKIGPNDPCICGSNRKYKKCCRK